MIEKLINYMMDMDPYEFRDQYQDQEEATKELEKILSDPLKKKNLIYQIEEEDPDSLLLDLLKN